ncbi:MAG: cell division protein ZapA [Rhodothermales bacterium]
MSLKSLRVEILDHEYPLRVTEQDEAFTKRLAAYVDGRMRQVQGEISGVSDLTYAVLGALAIAEELHLVRDELQQLRASIGTDADALADRLDAVLDADV